MMRTRPRALIYWDCQDASYEGWAWRIYRDGANLAEESGPLDVDAAASDAELIKAFHQQVAAIGDRDTIDVSRD